MKKIAILAAAAATLGLMACSHATDGAETNDAVNAEVVNEVTDTTHVTDIVNETNIVNEEVPAVAPTPAPDTTAAPAQ